MNAKYLTDTTGKALVPTGNRYEVKDTKIAQLRLRISPNGRKVWRVRIWLDGRWMSKDLGVFQQRSGAAIIMGSGAARHEAQAMLAKAGRKGQFSKDAAVLADMPRLSGWFEEYKSSNPRRLSERTLSDHSARMKSYISPALGDKRLHEIRSADLEDLTLTVERNVGARTANMCRSLVLALLRWAEVREMMPNEWRKPACPQAAENSVREDNYIPTHKAQDLSDAVRALRGRPSYRKTESETAADIILIALYTGARKSNILTMEWSELDLDRGVWNIPTAKYKTRRKTNSGASIPLIPLATELLQRRSRSALSGRWVFPSSLDVAASVDNIDKSWRWVRTKAGLPHVTFHGLRHTMGTWQGQLGVNQKLIAASLGQKDLDSTERYVHADFEVVRENMVQAVDANMLPADAGVSIRLPADRWEAILKALPKVLRVELAAAMG